MCDYDGDAEPCTVWREEPAIMSTAHFKGRPHECDSCGTTIARGDPYLRHANLFEGRWSSEKMCFACWWSREAFFEDHGSYQPPSGLWNMLQECIGENDDPLDKWRPHFAALKRRFRLTPQGRAHWARQKEYARRRRGRRSWLYPYGKPEAA